METLYGPRFAVMLTAFGFQKSKDINRKDRVHTPTNLLLGELRQKDLKFQASMGNLAGPISK